MRRESSGSTRTRDLLITSNEKGTHRNAVRILAAGFWRMVAEC
jgi:hypothetical protein